MKLPLIAADKANHILYGAAASLATHAGARLVVQTPVLTALGAAAGTALFLAVGKELYDRRRPQTHTSDWRDALATALGGVAACAAVALGRV